MGWQLRDDDVLAAFDIAVAAVAADMRGSAVEAGKFVLLRAAPPAPAVDLSPWVARTPVPSRDDGTAIGAGSGGGSPVLADAGGGVGADGSALGGGGGGGGDDDDGGGAAVVSALASSLPLASTSVSAAVLPTPGPASTSAPPSPALASPPAFARPTVLK